MKSLAGSYSPAPASIAVRGEGNTNQEYAAVRISEDTYNFRTDTGELIYQTPAETLAEKKEPVMAFRTDTGELIYQTSAETLVEKEESVMAFRSGNRVYFRDPNGGLVMKIFDGQSKGD